MSDLPSVVHPRQIASHVMVKHGLSRVQQAGTGPSRCHIQGSKLAKGLPSCQKSKNQKNGPSGGPGPASASPWRARRGTLPKLSTFLSQLKGDPLEKKQIFEKNLTMPKNWKGTLWDFSTSILSQNSKKMKGGPSGKFFSEKSLAVPKKLKGGTLWSRPVWYVTRENRKTLFGSLGQMVQFGAIIFCRTFKNYFGQLVWIEKKSHYNSRVSLMKRRLKNKVTRKTKKHLFGKCIPAG